MPEMSSAADAEADEARELLRLARHAALVARRRRRPLWLPLLCLGAATAAVVPLFVPGTAQVLGVEGAESSGTSTIAASPVAAAWWMAAFALAYVVVHVGFRARARASGWLSSPIAWFVGGALVCLSTLVTPPVGRPLLMIPALAAVVDRVHPGLAGFWIIAASLLALACVERRRVFTVITGATVLVTLGATLYDLTNVLPWLPDDVGSGTVAVVAVAASLIGGGLVLWWLDRRTAVPALEVE